MKKKIYWTKQRKKESGFEKGMGKGAHSTSTYEKDQPEMANINDKKNNQDFLLAYLFVCLLIC